MRSWISPLRKTWDVLVVLFVAGATLGFHVNQPSVFVFDEIYYANDALDLLTTGTERAFVMHPPLGKLLIASGIEVFGFTPLGWRVASVVAGAITVALTYAVVRNLTRSRIRGAFAALLVCLDGTFFVASRVAMLDIFVALWVMVTIWILLSERLRPKLSLTALFAGVALGLAVASKWSALPLAFVVIAALVHRGGLRRWRRGIALTALVSVVLVTTYVTTYAGWIVGGQPAANCAPASCGSTPVARLAELPHLTDSMIDAQAHLRRTNANLAPGWTWIVQSKPTTLLKERCIGQADGVCNAADRGTREIRSRGSRVLWISGIVAALVVASLTILDQRRRRRKGVRRAHLETRAGIILGSFVLLYAPWIAYPKTYSFYAVPLVPLLAVLVAIAIPAPAQPNRRRACNAMIDAVTAAMIGEFIVNWPIIG